MDHTHQIPYFVFAYAIGPAVHVVARDRGFGVASSALLAGFIVLGLSGALALIPALRVRTKRLWLVVASMPLLAVAASLVSDALFAR